MPCSTTPNTHVFNYDTGDGWIKIHRKLIKSEIADHPEYLALWIHLLWMAAYEEKRVLINGTKMLIKPGQFVTSRLKLAYVSGIQESKVERILNYFKTEQQIEQVNLSSCRLISIVNWDKYQSREQQIEQRVNSERTGTEQRVNTTKNIRIKECKNNQHSTNTYIVDEPSASSSKRKASCDEIMAYCLSLGLTATDGQWVFDKWEGNGWINGKAPIKDCKATIRAWKRGGYFLSQKNGNGHDPVKSEEKKLAHETFEKWKKEVEEDARQRQKHVQRSS